MSRTQADQPTTPKAQLLAQLALIMEQHQTSDQTLDDQTLLAYLDGKLSTTENAHVRATLASNPILLEQFMAIADQLQPLNQTTETNTTQNTHANQASIKTPWLHRLKSYWLLIGSGSAGGLIAASITLFIVLSPTLEQPLYQGFDHLPPGAQIEYTNGIGRKSLHSQVRKPEQQALAQGIEFTVQKAGGTESVSESETKLLDPKAHCNGNSACLSQLQTATRLGIWMGLTQLYCSDWANVPQHAWHTHLDLAKPLSSDVEHRLTDDALKQASTALFALVTNTQKASQVNLQPMCRAVDQFIAAFYRE